MSKKRSAKGQFVSARKAKITRAPRKRRKNPDAGPAALVATGATSNPQPFQDLVEFIIPGFAGYAGTKFLARIVNVQLSKRFPNAGKHVAAGSTIMAFLAAWFLLHRIKRLEKYHTPAVVGSAIASLQTLVQTYLPKYGWIVSDYRSEEVKSFPISTTSSKVPVETLFPGGPEVVDDSAPADDLSDLPELDLGVLGAAGADQGEDYMTN